MNLNTLAALGPTLANVGLLILLVGKKREAAKRNRDAEYYKQIYLDLAYKYTQYPPKPPRPIAKPAPKGVAPSADPQPALTGQRVRRRWQNDILHSPKSSTSEKLTAERIKKQDKEGNLRLQGDGNLWGSSLGNGMHAPILDLDMPHTYVPSKTEGHGHLYIHKAIDHRSLTMILAALFRAGLTGEGNIHQFEARGQMFAACTSEASVRAGETPIEMS